MMTLFGYILKRDAKITVTNTSDLVSVNIFFEIVFEHEASNTKAIYSLVKFSHNEEDWLHGVSCNGS
jgi:ferritin